MVNRFLKTALVLLSTALVLYTGCKKKNTKPDKPVITAGVSSGRVNVSYEFSATTTDPDGDSISIRFDWNDGDTSDWSNYVVNGETIKVSHIWQDSGTYSVRAQARDKKEATSDWSEPFTITIIANQPPNPPATPSGPTTAFKDSLCSFKTGATDPDGDSVAIRFDWGDGDTSDWSPLVASAETVSLSHSWQTGGTYAIRAQGKDKYNAVSNWSGPFEITIIANRAPNPPATPTGPSQGRKDSVYTFSTVTTDPDGDAVCYRFAFGDGDTSDWTIWVQSGTPATITHSYQNSGTYSVKAQAKDVNEVLSSWSNSHQIVITNFLPDTPGTPSGPSAGFRDTSYNFSVSATDPDGDSVAIRFAWGDGDTSNWSVYVPSGQTVTMNHSWRDSGIYYVKAQAKDKEGSVSSWSSGHQIAIEIPWRLATSSAGWSPRYGHTSVVFDNKIWVLGGYDYRNDVWYSSDGVNWTRATANAGWSPRYVHTSVVFDNKIWILGGDDGSRRNDVWYSSDGVNWTRATANAGWSPRYQHTSVVFDNKIWVLGGHDGSRRNDVWYSSDGVNWTRATANADWSPRYGHTSVVFDNKIWVLGGDDGSRRNDVWYSSDGVNWTRATDNAGWSPRYVHTSVVFDNKIWILGGDDGSNRNDVWYSSDGVNWTRATANAGWSPRNAHTSVVFNNKIWILGGYDGSRCNDVWYWP